MTNLERALAEIFGAIEQAGGSGNPQVLAALLRRKQAICAALAAPEQSWHAPIEQSSPAVSERKAA